MVSSPMWARTSTHISLKPSVVLSRAAMTTRIPWPASRRSSCEPSGSPFQEFRGYGARCGMISDLARYGRTLCPGIAETHPGHHKRSEGQLLAHAVEARAPTREALVTSYR